MHKLSLLIPAFALLKYFTKEEGLIKGRNKEVFPAETFQQIINALSPAGQIFNEVRGGKQCIVLQRCCIILLTESVILLFQRSCGNKTLDRELDWDDQLSPTSFKYNKFV